MLAKRERERERNEMKEVLYIIIFMLILFPCCIVLDSCIVEWILLSEIRSSIPASLFIT